MPTFTLPIARYMWDFKRQFSNAKSSEECFLPQVGQLRPGSLTPTCLGVCLSLKTLNVLQANQNHNGFTHKAFNRDAFTKVPICR